MRPFSTLSLPEEQGHEAQLKKLNAQLDQQRKEYEGYLAALTVE